MVETYTIEEPAMTASSVQRIVIVAAASRHGSTAEIADRIADRLREDLPHHWSVCRSDPGNAWSFPDADAVVLGSAIYFGRWLRPARQALQRIDDRDHVWLFSSGPIVAPDDSEQLTEHGRSAHHPHATFGGLLDPSRLSRLECILARLVHAGAGDYRDWSAIDRWADGIADELSHTFDSHHQRTDADGADLHLTGARP
jgi:menaquinone-dependent protoporphyrinogen oxidase